MSKLACSCGHIISDTTDGLPYKARLLPDAHDEDFFVTIAEAAAALVDACAKDGRDDWLKERGFLEGYPNDLSNSDVFSDFVLSLWLKYSRECYECTSCGRLYMQEKDRSNFFSAFTPDSGMQEGLLGPRTDDA